MTEEQGEGAKRMQSIPMITRQYSVEHFDTFAERAGIESHLNAKAQEGWKLHTIQVSERTEVAGGDKYTYHVYYLAWERWDIEGELPQQ